MDAELIKATTVADVYKGSIKAATLTRESTAVTFEYLPQYIAAGGASIAYTLPAHPDAPAVRVENGALPTFFAGLLPEGFRFAQLAQDLKVSTSDEFRLLLAVGKNLPGDVRVLPHKDSDVSHGDGGADQHGEDDVAEVDLDEALDFSVLMSVTGRVSIPGVQGKISAGRGRRAVTAAGRSGLRAVTTERSAQQYILKYDTVSFPLLSRNEYEHLKAARALGIPVEGAQLLRDKHGTEGLLADRFDRVVAPRTTAITRLAMEDASQLLNLPPAAKYDPTSEEVAGALVDACNAKPVARRNIFLQTAFAYLTGNGDLHAKNYSVLQGLDGAWTMAPIYDVACTLVYGDKTMALSVAGRRKELRIEHWLEFAREIGLPEKAARTSLGKALLAARKVDLAGVGFQGSTLSGARRILSRRHDETEKDLLRG